jgi:outer membrane phospholipase A
VPEFFGKTQCEQVFDATGNDISHEFHLSLAYKMKKVDGTFIKCGLQDDLKRALNEYLGWFPGNGESLISGAAFQPPLFLKF